MSAVGIAAAQHAPQGAESDAGSVEVVVVGHDDDRRHHVVRLPAADAELGYRSLAWVWRPPRFPGQNRRCAVPI